jgi:CheY-like chemotaxis protein/predicted Ser/Thr protein kinase
MEPVLDSATLGKHAVRLGLISAAQLEEAREEADSHDPHALLRVLERRTLLTPWQSSKLLKGDPDGYFLGGYRLLYKIASGSFGRVFRADDPNSGRIVAVKVLRRRWSEDAQRIELFAREAKVGLTLKHPNIVEILAMSQDPKSKQYFIVMEFVEGGNLREILQIRKTLDLSHALRIIEDAASGLAYAQARGITHRDMKLTNILIGSDGTAKLVDFGLAGITAGADFKSDKDDKDDKGKGERQERTVDYAGLEKATNVKHGDTRSDIYFLGCVLYEILSGRPPLETTRDKNQRMRFSRFREVKPLTPNDIQVSPVVFQLIETMMSLDPTSRYQTASQLLDAVRSVRREVEGKGAGVGAAPQPTLFIVEGKERLQDAFREKFKELGYRVLLASDPLRALDRFRQQPFNALIIDAGTAGMDGVRVFDQVMNEAVTRGVPCSGVVLLNEDQEDFAAQMKPRKTVAALRRPVTLKQLHRKLTELMALARGAEADGGS